MKWKKIGKIFDPGMHEAFRSFVGFAQSPQALELEDCVRIYFSIRKADDSGKFTSHIAFVDFLKDFSAIKGTSTQEVIPLGPLGSFDEHGIFPISPFKHNGKIYAYTCGWSRRKSVSVETSTGLAFSSDQGETFQKLGIGPVFSSSLHEPFLVGDSFVRFFDGMFHMWYIFGTGWIQPPGSNQAERIYKIGYALSNDGIDWNRGSRQIISDVIGPDECQALPSVVKWNGSFHMYFCYRHVQGFRTNPELGYRLGYAHSVDMIHWTRDDAKGATLVRDDWDINMMCYPHVFECNKKLHLLYNGNEFGKHGFGLAVLE